MKIHNIRHGFATNSSSSHSILILPQGTPLPPNQDHGTYGWDNFVLSSPESKQGYLDTQASYMNGTRDPDSYDTYVDHQSEWGNEGLSLTDRVSGASTNSPEVMAFLQRLMKMDRTVVLGGNDNEDPHPLLDTVNTAGAVALRHNESWGIIRDPKGHSVLFNSRNGTKLRFTDDGGDAPTKGTWPELVDVKITDYCPYGCEYCYQGSTTKGRHAPLEHLEALAARCRQSGVLEIAIGGGEPTLHPDFARIVEAFRSAGLVVNVTSRNIAYWVTAPKVGVTAVAFSVDSAQEIRNIKERFSGVYPHFQIHYQVVVGTVDVAEFQRMIEAAEDSRLTLLGYKDTGRGAAARGSLPVCNAPNQTEWLAPWVARVQAWHGASEAREAWEAKRSQDFFGRYSSPISKASGESRERLIEAWYQENPFPEPRYRPNLAIDTTLASLCKNELKKAGVPPVVYHSSEGAFSMYIDAVTQEAGPCSYAPPLMQSYTIETLWDTFASILSIDGSGK